MFPGQVPLRRFGWDMAHAHIDRSAAQHRVGGRSQQPLPSTATVGTHHDQVAMFGFCEFVDLRLRRRMAHEDVLIVLIDVEGLAQLGDGVPRPAPQNPGAKVPLGARYGGRCAAAAL